MDNNKASKKPKRSLLNSKQPWSRSDKIAMVAFVISILSTLINIALTSVATNVAYTADQRTFQSDVRGAEAVVAALGDKVRLLAQSAEYSAMFLEAFLGRLEQHPEDAKHVKQLTFELLQRMALPDLEFSTEQLSWLARRNSDAASKLAKCASRRTEVDLDITSIAAVKATQLTMEQEHTLNMLPYRLHVLSEVCTGATTSFAAIAPDLQRIDEPLRGTLGELAAAQKIKEDRKKSGLNATLEISKGQNSPASQPSKESIH